MLQALIRRLVTPETDVSARYARGARSYKARSRGSCCAVLRYACTVIKTKDYLANGSVRSACLTMILGVSNVAEDW
jgi:hypothetical protein